MRTSICICIAAALALPAVAQEPPGALDRVTINVVEQDLGSVLRLLAESQRINIIAGPEVTGFVTLNLYEVPFEDAITAILNVSGFSWYRVGGIIYVTTEERRGEMAPSVGEMEVATFVMNHVEPEAMSELVAGFLSRGGRALAGVNKTLVVVDMPERIATVSKLIAAMDHPKRQVLIQVHIVNVQRDNNLNLGTGFDTFPLSRYGVEALTQGFAEPFPPSPDPETGLIPNLFPTSTGFYTGTLQRDFRAFIQALDTATDTEILASPQLLVLDGEEARLQVGDRLGFRITTTTETASLESVEFLEVGTVLEVTPNISADGLVQLEITPKVSSGFIDTEGLPTESTTEVSTSMLVQDGQTVIIGGLLNATKQRIKTQIPFLGDLPLIGKLFGRSNWTDDQSEVVVFLTPHILEPVPTPEMRQKIEAARERWQPFEEQGLIHADTPALNDSPAKRWRNLFQQRGALPMRTEVKVDLLEPVPEAP